MSVQTGWQANRALYQVFERYADLIEIEGGEDVRKAATYRRAAIALRGLDRPVDAIAADGRLREIPGIGPVLEAKIQEYLQTGRIAALDRLEAAVPPGVLELLELPGVGARTAGSLWRGLKVASPAELEAAIRAGRLKELGGFGPKREQTLLAALTGRGSPRLILSEAWGLAEALRERMLAVPGVSRAEVAGEARRGCPLSDAVVLVASGESGPIASMLAALAIWARDGAPKPVASAVTATLESGVPLRIVLAPAAAFGTAMVLATGSAAHAAALGALPAAAEEEGVYSGLDLPFIAPELREGAGEVEAARAGRLPHLITEADIRGDLHVHSRWSDGSAAVAEMAAAAIQRGDRYLAITDHSRALVIAHGLGPEEIRRQRREIEDLKASGALGGLVLLQGCEVEVLADGRLDLDDDSLAGLDFVIASLHSRFGQDGPTLTERALRAVRHPLVDMIGHPSGRRLPERPEYPIDLERVIDEAASAGKALEINGSPERCDLDGAWARRAKDRGVPLSVDSDAHSLGGLAGRRFGVMTARRGWLQPEQALNTKEPEQLLAWLKGRRA
ncbi:MAG TPA: PHP domain-containing protein [Bacillota bacterium]|nr:PHP domain-containing protein [Bacillota bacterium]